MKTRTHNEIHHMSKVNQSIAVHDRNAKDKDTGEIAGKVDIQQAEAKTAAAIPVAVPRMIISLAARLLPTDLETLFRISLPNGFPLEIALTATIHSIHPRQLSWQSGDKTAVS